MLTVPSFGELFRELLRLHSTTQAAFAKAVGVSQATLSRRLSGEHPPGEREVRRWWSKIQWPDSELQAALSSLAGLTPMSLPTQSLAQFPKFADLFPHDVLIGELREGGILYRLAAELATAEDAWATELRSLVAAACEMHRLSRDAKAQFSQQLQMWENGD